MAQQPSPPYNKICKTSFGRFNIKVSSTNIHVGGKNTCVTIAIKQSPSRAELSWLSTEEGGCALDHKVIHGIDTLRMVDLAFTLLRTHFPHITDITLLDDSGIYLTDADTSERRMKLHLKEAYFLLYGKTWYEDKFGATMIPPSAYNEYRQRADAGFNDPSKKPDAFDFGTANDELQPLYQSSSTWGEFINKIKSLYQGKEKYKIISEWYRLATTYILGIGIISNWRIDISIRPIHTCTSLEGGGTRRRRRQRMTRKGFPKYYKIEPYFENRGSQNKGW